jgi:hypothetical protein
MKRLASVLRVLQASFLQFATGAQGTESHKNFFVYLSVFVPWWLFMLLPLKHQPLLCCKKKPFVR